MVHWSIFSPGDFHTVLPDMYKPNPVNSMSAELELSVAGHSVNIGLLV